MATDDFERIVSDLETDDPRFVRRNDWGRTRSAFASRAVLGKVVLLLAAFAVTFVGDAMIRGDNAGGLLVILFGVGVISYALVTLTRLVIDHPWAADRHPDVALDDEL